MTKICKCGNEFTVGKRHIWQKQCEKCKEETRRLAKQRWYEKNGREYMKNYMKTYRLLSFAFLFIVVAPQISEAEFSGSFGFRGTFQKPPAYELNLKTGDRSYIALNRFSLRKKGWMPKQETREDDEENILDLFQSDPKEAGSWGVEYGAVSTMSEISLLEQESIYGWKVGLGQVSEFAWGKGMDKDRIAAASFNTEKFNFMVTKSFGMKEKDDDYQFLTDPAKAGTANPNLPIVSAIPITKGEGGALKIPFNWRQTTGDFEVAGRKRFDEALNDYKNGIAMLLNFNTPRFSTTIRNIGKGYESNIRTTDIGLRIPIYKTENTTVRLGGKTILFSEDKPDTRYEGTIGLDQSLIKGKDYSFRASADAGAHIQGEKIGLTATGNISAMLFNTNLTLRRSENFTGQSQNITNSISISRKEVNLTVMQNNSEYGNNSAENLNATINITPFKDFRAGAGIGRSISETIFKITETINSNYSLSYRTFRFTATLSPRAENYNLSRDFQLDKYGKSVNLGFSYQRFLKGDGFTGNLTYTW